MAYSYEVRRKSSYPANRLRGITPVASVWGVDPTNLERATDDNWANVTGTGNKVLGGAGQYGQLDFDMGAIHNVEIRCKALLGNNIVAGTTVAIWLYASEDNITFYLHDSSNYQRSLFDWIANGTMTKFFHAFVRARYIRLHFHCDAAGTGYGGIYEIQAVDDGL